MAGEKDNMDGYLYSSSGPAAGVRALLTQPPAPLAYLLTESAADSLFETFTAPAADWQPWPSGRAFGEETEVRWQQVGPEGFQLLVASEARQPGLAGAGWREEKLEAGPGGRIFLWGRHRDYLAGSEGGPDEWLQASIPRPLRYPLTGRPEYAWLKTVPYRRAGVIVFTRLCGIGPMPGEEEKG